MGQVLVKICGLSTPDTLDAALEAGADFVGLVFFAKSPRHVSHATAADLATRVQGRAKIVALCVDPSDAELEAIIAASKADILQLHGHETPARVTELRRAFGLPVMKAVGISSRSDLAASSAFEPVCDRLLYDAKPPKDALVPGGNGVTFDWTLLANHRPSIPWMLSGGLTPENVAEAIRQTGARAVDVSSGVESAPGVKDKGLIRAFIAAAQGAP